MSIFRKILGGSSTKPSGPDIKMGRFSDAYKADAKYDAWDKALEQFDAGEYLESYRLFFDYLLDDAEQNVRTWEDDGAIHFELLQGSKMIKGMVTRDLISAEAKVARVDTMSIGFLRRMIEQNFSLKYSRFALDPQDNLTLKFESYLEDGSPYKLYYALKEIAVQSDKQDDLLIDEFEMLKPINTGHVSDIPEAQKAVKYQFFHARIKAILNEMDNGKLNGSQYPGGFGYLLLDAAYRIDYLTKPEGPTMEALERIHRMYFAPDGKQPEEKNQAVRKEFEKMLALDAKTFYKELYSVKSSFGITSPSSHKQLVDFIDSELHNMEWYVENKHIQVAMSIPGYIVGYSLFNYSFPKPDRELLHFYYRIVESTYFSDLGFQPEYHDPKTGTFNKRAIKAYLSEIESRNKVKFPNLSINAIGLKYDSLVNFAKTYLEMIKGLDMTKSN